MAGFGWAGSVESFLTLEREEWIRALQSQVTRLFSRAPSAEQVEAWYDEHATMSTALETCVGSTAAAARWGVIFEYELPLEGGRRPDVVVLAGAAVVVVEFKGGRAVTAADRDQAAAYARDLSDYHKATHGRDCCAFICATRARHGFDAEVVKPLAIASLLLERAGGEQIALQDWLNASYAPLPALVDAARSLFNHEHVPHVWQAESAGVPETVEFVQSLAAEAAAARARRLVLVAGVPGAGKTLVGLRVVYEGDKLGQATFLSGNRPLVAVLQDALNSRAFVRDLHAYIETYGFNVDATPEEHVLVFDEAQRAWDADQVERRHRVRTSEPELLLKIGQRVPDWSVLVGLVGEGQSIHTGEEAGLPQWRDALLATEGDWTVHAPERMADTFSGLHFIGDNRLDLTVSLRSKRAVHLHDWVHALLTDRPQLAAEVAAGIDHREFPLYVTRDLGAARRYARRRYEKEPERKFGLVASSRAKNLQALGIDNSYEATGFGKLDIAGWFNADPGDAKSCCQLTQPVTEFGCQGLELDLPIVCWGDDFVWNGDAWSLTGRRPQRGVHDPHLLRANAYRVLLTRGRDGLVIFVPATRDLDPTYETLRQSGCHPLPLTGFSGTTPARFEFNGSHDLKRLLITCRAFRQTYDALPTLAVLSPEVLQDIAAALDADAFHRLSAALTIRTTSRRGVLSLRGATGTTLSYDTDLSPAYGEALIDPADPDYAEIGRWLGLPECVEATSGDDEAMSSTARPATP